MKRSHVLSLVLSAVVAVAGFNGNAHADDAAAQAKLAQAKELFAARADLAKNEEAIKVLAAAEKEATETLTKYDVLVLASRALYFKGGKQKTPESKMAVYQEGMNKAKAAYALNNTFAEAYYFHAINLGKWGLAKGIDVTILARAAEGKKLLETAMKLKQRDGATPGDQIDGYGPYRTLTKMNTELKMFPGWNLDKALEHGNKAWTGANWLPCNGVYYAEALFKDGKDAKAKQVLNEVLNNPARLHADRGPENAEELADARKLLKDNE